MMKKWIIPLLFAWLGGFTAASAQTTMNASRGELLYSTHCLACHSAQIHWREKKVAKNWSTLKDVVGQWQRTSGLIWNEEDVTAVARYLNDQYYHFQTGDIANANSSTSNTAK